ncbi:MAG: hypothetical protein BGO21_02945 [Dyadobacter sp. 50-39]|uniref:hypothetical protein n=1 Tax=Dyadobacter sp. 50-39 TaxID=1895756 RepID=UPI00095C3EBD|nr:hypothetical protein [Dyadobacter sp. 50-39]OJV12718.1 MAG: hypothetical protein BGO21_02945 [Dyadobacter sp. 50-39]
MTIIIWSFAKSSPKRFFLLFGLFVIAEAALIGGSWYIAKYQTKGPFSENYVNWVRQQYAGSFKNTTNFNSTLSQYDSLLTYRFRPNITGRFKNPEFDIEIKTNSLGVRDDEASLLNPSIIILGDSHGMGWGVEQSERFSEIIERKLNTRVLNTAITSYGSHRETSLLDEVEMDSCKLLIIQYCDNDLEENKANLLKAQNPSIDKHGFDVAERQNKVSSTYFPFKGIFATLRWLIGEAFKKTPPPAIAQAAAKPVAPSVRKLEHAEAFFPYLSRIRTRYKGLIVVFDLGVYNFPIVGEFQAYQSIKPMPEIYFVNVHPLLDRRYYFTIDDHINVRGHAKIGVALSELIQQKRWLKN